MNIYIIPIQLDIFKDYNLKKFYKFGVSREIPPQRPHSKAF